MTTNILITGAGGQLGREFSALAHHFPGMNISALDRNELDITRAGDIERALAKKDYDFCINCAAYTAVDRAEQEAGRAQAINRDGVKNLGLACRQAGIKLFHFSTDYVYHNHLNRPLIETDPTTPQSIYAQTKLAGEELLISNLPSALILRTSWVYSGFGHNFVKTMLRLGREHSSLRIVYDQIGTPTYARDIARTCLQIIEQIQSGNRSWEGGVFNFSNEGVCSWYDFALAIFELSHISCSVQPIESKDYPTPAQRPSYSVLNKTKFKSVFQMTIPHWRDALRRCLATM